MSYLISLILLLLPTYLIRFSIFGIPTTVLEILIYVIFLYGLFQAKKIGFRPVTFKIILPILLLVLALIISIIIAPDKRMALGEFKGFFVDPMLVFWLVWQFVEKDDIGKILAGLIASGTFVAIYTIVEKILGQTTADGRVIGIFGYSPNYVALYLAPVAVLLFGLQLTVHRPLLKNKLIRLTVNGLLLTVILAAMYFSGSRGGFLAVAAGIGIFVIIHNWLWIKKRLSAKIIITVLILMALYTSWIFFRPDFSVSPESGGRIATSNNLRFTIWQTTLELASKQPIFGVGLGNFQNAFGGLTQNRANFSEYITPLAATPHNIFLMFYLETGLLGLFSFFWLLVIFYRQALKNIVTNSTAVILVAVMSSILIYGLVEASIWKNDLSIIFWTIFGLAWTRENANLKMQKSK